MSYLQQIRLCISVLRHNFKSVKVVNISLRVEGYGVTSDLDRLSELSMRGVVNASLVLTSSPRSPQYPIHTRTGR